MTWRRRPPIPVLTDDNRSLVEKNIAQRDEIRCVSAPRQLERKKGAGPLPCDMELNRAKTMKNKIRILFLSANPWTTSRILVDEEAREVFEKLQEGPYRDRFELYRHSAIRAVDLQRLLMTYEPHIVHFSGHGSKKQKIILGGTPGRGKQVDRDGLVQVFALYRNHVRLIVLNACFTRPQARSLSQVIDYSVGAGKGIGDKEGVAFAGAFYRAIGFGRSVKAAFESAKAELALTRMPRTKGIELIIRKGVNENDSFPVVNSRAGKSPQPAKSGSEPFATHSSVHEAIQRQNVSIQEAGRQIAEPQVPRFDIEAAIAQICETDFHSCEHAAREFCLMRTKKGVASLVLSTRSDQLRGSALGTPGKASRTRLADAKPNRNEIGWRSTMDYSRACATLTIKFFKVGLSDPRCKSHPRARRPDQPIRRRVQPAKRFDRCEGSKSGSD
jgi:hypothetical protein